MEETISLGKVKFIVRYIPTNELLETIVDFQDRNQDIYYCWEIKDKNRKHIASKCLPVSKRIIKENELSYCTLHAKDSIDGYRIGRKRMFQVEGVQQL